MVKKIKFGKHSFNSFKELDSVQRLAVQNGIKTYQEFIIFLDTNYNR